MGPTSQALSQGHRRLPRWPGSVFRKEINHCHKTTMGAFTKWNTWQHNNIIIFNWYLIYDSRMKYLIEAWYQVCFTGNHGLGTLLFQKRVNHKEKIINFITDLLATHSWLQRLYLSTIFKYSIVCSKKSLKQIERQYLNYYFYHCDKKAVAIWLQGL